MNFVEKAYEYAKNEMGAKIGGYPEKHDMEIVVINSTDEPIVIVH
jgi:hypothetical protein